MSKPSFTIQVPAKTAKRLKLLDGVRPASLIIMYEDGGIRYTDTPFARQFISELKAHGKNDTSK